MFRRISSVPKSLRRMWIVAQITVVAALIALVTGITLLTIALFTGNFTEAWAIDRMFIIATVVSVVTGSISTLLVRGLGDAARYLVSSADNVAVRTSVRQGGLR